MMHSFFRQFVVDSGLVPGGLPETLAVELAAEQILNGGTRTYSPHSHIIRGLEDRYIPAGRVQRHEGLRLYEDLGNRARFFGRGTPKLAVHPNSLRSAGISRRLEALPFSEHPFYALSSLRSVVYESGGEWRRAKLHLEDVQVSRYFRNLGGRTIEHSVAVSADLAEHWEKVCAAFEHPMELCFYEESGGTVLKNEDASNRTGEWGSIARSSLPKGCSAENCAAVPLFAFYGERNERLLDVMLRESGETPADFIFHRIMEPVIRAWTAVFETTGIIWEPHAQNMVFLCDLETLEPKAVALRDADTAVSSSKRSELGLSCGIFFDRNVHDGKSDPEMPRGEQSEISRCIDSSMGRNTFDYLCAFADGEELQSRCRELFGSVFPDRGRWFPDEVFGYARDPLPNDRNCYPLEAKADSPVWR